MTKISAEIFKANDIRGIVGETLSEKSAYLIGQALAAEAREQNISSISLGRDGRLSSPALATALGGGLQSGGLRVHDIGVVPTPALYFAAATRTNGSGVMVTGSHNPKNYNGMKIVLDGKTLKGETVQALRQRIENDDFGSPQNTPAGERKTLDIREEYIAEVIRANSGGKKLKVVVDAGNGAAGDFAPELYRKMNCEVYELFCELDGNFPNHHPDPANPKNLADATAALSDFNADIAFVFDGDGDRLGVIFPAEEALFADRLLMLFASDMLSRNAGGGVVFDVKCTANLKPWVEKHGGVAYMQPTGHSFIKASMKQTGALLGGEMSGHFYFSENWYGFDDALFAGARLIDILSNGGSMANIPNSVASRELMVDMSGKDQHAFIRTAQQYPQRFTKAENIITIDGLRVEYANGFGLVRASNTTPSLVMRFEAEDTAGLASIQEQFRTVLLAIDKTLKLPF